MLTRHLVRLVCVIVLLASAPLARAVNHNPDTQPGSDKVTGDVKLKNPHFINAGQSYTATVDVAAAQHPEVAQYGLTVELHQVGENNTVGDIITSQSVSGEGTVTFSNIDVTSLKSCAVAFKLIGATGDMEGSSADANQQATLSGGGSSTGMGSVDAYYDLGKSASGYSAGRLLIYTDSPTTDLYSPVMIRAVVTDPAAEVLHDGTPAYVRQILTATQLTDVVVLTDDSYEIRFYAASQKGTKSGGFYQPTGTPFEVVKIENPGITPIAGTTDDALYVDARWGKSFSYKLPVPDGPYKVGLYFAELYHDAAGAAVFNVTAEGQTVLPNYDVLAAAGSKNTARVEEVAATVSDGELDLGFSAITYGAQVSALKVVRAGAVPIAGTSDSPLYQSERTGNFSYAIPLANGSYQVTLYFSESTYQAAGKRTFDVTAEGVLALHNYDIYAQAGAANTAHTETIPVTLSDGELDLQFTGITGKASVSGIKVVDTATGSVVAAINAGGPAYTAGDGTAFAADANYTGGDARYPGQVVLAINCGGPAYTAADGTVFAADQDFSEGYSYNGALNRVRITTTETGSAAQVYDYHWITEPATGEFGEATLAYPNGLKTEGKSVVYSQDRQTYVDTRTVRDASSNLVSKTATHYENFAWGFAKVSEVVDPDGAALTTTWTYVEGSANPADPKPNGYGQVLMETDPNGYWQQYSYDSSNRVSQIVSQYLNSAPGDTGDSRVETISYGTSNPVETHVVTIAGQEVSRTYIAEFDDPTNHEFERWNITAVTPGAAWNASGNLVSKTHLYKSDNPTTLLQGQTKWTSQPDGTMTIYGYAMSGANKVVTQDTGAPNGTATAIADGTRTVTTTNPAGQQIAQDTIDIASGLTLQSWTALTIDALGRPTLIGYGDGTTKSIVYQGSAAACGTCSSAGNFLVASETDRNGVTTTYSYDALNRRTDTTTLGVTTHVVYDAAGRVLETHRIGTDSSDIRQQKTVYDLAGRVTETDDALNNATTTAYAYPSGGGTVTTTTSPATAAGAGTRIETTYGDGKIASISGTAVSPLNYAYGTWASGEWTQEIKVGASGATTEWTKTYVDLAGRQVQVAYPDGAHADSVYSVLGQLASQTDPDGVATLYAYNARGERTVTALDLDRNGVIDYTGTDRITKTVNDVVSYSGTVVNRTTTQVWATNGANTPVAVSVAEQDGYGNQGWQVDASGAVTATALARTAAGAWTVTTTAPNGSQQIQTYSGGLLASTTTKDNAGAQVTQTTYAYDPDNRVATQTDARTGDTTFTYDALDRVLTTTVNHGADTTTNTYDALGNLLTRTLPDNSVTTNTYYLLNNLLQKTSGSQTYPVGYTYDPQGRMKTLTTWQDAGANTGAAVTTWAYDSQRGWLTGKIYDDGHGPTYTYTPAGRLLTRTWARTVGGSALVTTYGYTNAGDLATTTYSDGVTPNVSIAYTRFGAQSTVTDASGTRTFTYNAALQPDQEQLDATFYGGRILTRTYETTGATIGRSTGFEVGASGNLTQDYAVTYGYDNAGRLGTVTDPNGTFTYDYLANSNLRSTLTGPVHTATTTYEPYRDVIASVENKVGTTTISKYAYTVNNLGQRTQRANTGTAFATASTDSFSYDAKGQVTGALNSVLSTLNRSYSYDDIGNRKSATDNTGTTGYTANDLNQYSGILTPSSTLLAPSYDLDGNMVATGGGQVYTWDGENRLVSVEPLVPTGGSKKQVNAYDAQGRRVRKTVLSYDGSAWNVDTDEKFVYDGWNVAEVLGWNPSTSAFELNKTYTWGSDLSGSLQGAGGVGGLLSVKDGSAVYAYTYDANGNVSEVLDASGGIAAHYEYDAFGNTVASIGTYAAINAYRFSSKPLDDVSGLYYYGLRYYNPAFGGWPNRDSIEESGGFDLYGFDSNSPIGNYDRIGLQVIEIWTSAYIPYKTFLFAYPTKLSTLARWYGDDRTTAIVGGSARAYHRIKIETDPKKSAVILNISGGGTTKVDYTPGIAGLWGINFFTDTASDVAPPPARIVRSPDNHKTTVTMSADTSDPLVPGAPSLHYDYTMVFDTCAGKVTVDGSIKHFPAYDIILNGVVLENALPGSYDSPVFLIIPATKIKKLTANIKKY